MPQAQPLFGHMCTVTVTYIVPWHLKTFSHKIWVFALINETVYCYSERTPVKSRTVGSILPSYIGD